MGTSHAHGTQTHLQAKYSYTRNKIKKIREGGKGGMDKDPSIDPARGLGCLVSIFVVNKITSLGYVKAIPW